MDKRKLEEIWDDFRREIQKQEGVIFSEITQNPNGIIPPWVTQRNNAELGVKITDFINSDNNQNVANNEDIACKVQTIIRNESGNLRSSNLPVLLIIYSDTSKISTPMMENILSNREFLTVVNSRINEVYFVLSYEPDGKDGRYPYIPVRISNS